uniref:Uncharacterized protein n=1 Tax=Avena sativa TaxID=4498 RepID=A0ACD5ZKI1_AVESA
MAVNAQHLPHMILSTNHNQPCPTPAWLSANQSGASTVPTMTLSYAAAPPEQNGYQSSYMVTPPPSVGGQDQYTEFLALAAVDLAKRGATLHGSVHSHEMVAGYKRKRDEQSVSILDTDYVQQQQTIVIDPLLLDHAAKMWKDLAEQRQKHMRLITSAVEDRAAKRLKAKDLEMDLIRGVNGVLQERLRNLHREVEVWRDFARSNEDVVSVLHDDLQCTRAQEVRGRGVDDTSSCCWGDNHMAFCGGPEVALGVRRCKGCGQGEAVVLLLPCSHLCVCAPCAAMTRACPACGCVKTGSIRVNFS